MGRDGALRTGSHSESRCVSRERRRIINVGKGSEVVSDEESGVAWGETNNVKKLLSSGLERGRR
jgi:hypothetical protein